MSKVYKVSILKWNKEFGKRGRWPFIVSYVHLDGDKAIVHHKLGIIGRIIVFLMSPLLYIYGVFAEGHKESVRMLSGLLFQDNHGSDEIRKCEPGWDKLMDMLK